MEFKRVIHASECDFTLKASLYGLANIVQDCATETLEAIHFDNVRLKEKYQAMWVFTKNQIKCFRRPEWHETITIRTRNVKTNRLINYLLIEMFDQKEELIISDLLELCVINCNTYRFVRLDSIQFPAANEPIEIDYTIDNVEYDKEITPVQVNAMLLDYSKHMNNAQSLWIYLSSLTMNEMEALYEKPFVFTIKYCAQAYFNQQLYLKKYANNGLYSYCLVKDENEPIILAQIKHIEK